MGAVTTSERFGVSARVFVCALVLVLAVLGAAALRSGSAEAAGASSVSSGEDFSCAVTEAGGVVCWGYSASGQLGNGVIDGPQICGGAPSNEYPCAKIPVPVTGLSSGVKSVSAGDSFACATMTGGTVKCWGRNDLGQLGSGSLGPDTCQDFFGDRPCSSTPVDVAGLTDVDRVEAGLNHACALLNNGGVFCWGYGALGQLGDNGPDDCDGAECSLSPIGTPFISGVIDLAAGGFHTCIISQQTEALCWGDNEFGQIGNGVAGPDDCFAGRTIKCSRDAAPVDGLNTGVTDITAGDVHTCALVGGEAKCWGYNGKYQLARDEPDSCANINSECFSRTPVDIAGVSGDMIEAGAEYTCVSSGDEIQCWGRNFGQLDGGSGPDECPTGLACSKDPIGPDGIAGDIEQIAPGGSHTCVLLEGGQVQCWGDGFFGQIGDGTGEDGDLATSPTGFEGTVPTATPAPTGETRELPWGDSDCNAAMSARDNQAILRTVLSQAALSQTQPCFAIGSDVTVDGSTLKWADADCNGSITARDNQAVLRFILGQAALGQTEPCPDVGSAVAVP